MKRSIAAIAAIGAILLCALASIGSEAPSMIPYGSVDPHPTNDVAPLEACLSLDLAEMGESSLFAVSKTNQALHVYRFNWLRSADNPVVFTIELLNSSNAVLTVKTKETISKDGKRLVGSPVTAKRRTLNCGEVENLFGLLRAAKFWDLVGIDWNWRAAGAGGSNWLFEGIRDGKYHVVLRHSPVPPFGPPTTPAIWEGLYRNSASRTEPVAKVQEKSVSEENDSASVFGGEPEPVTGLHASGKTVPEEEVGLDILLVYIIQIGGMAQERLY